MSAKSKHQALRLNENPPRVKFGAVIKVVGVGGSGGNAISHMVASHVRNVEFIAMNTDAQDLHHTLAATKLRIGKKLTHGLGTGMNPAVGQRAAEESQEEIAEALKGADLVFVTGGLGGGTCSGAAPVVAEVAKKLGALVVAVVTLPFTFEGRQRARIAQEAWGKLCKNVDSIVTVENDRILETIERHISLPVAFKAVNDVLKHAVSGIADIITVPGLVNLDFADLRAIMEDSGEALLGLGQEKGQGKAVQAAKGAIASPLIDLSIHEARGILFTVTGSPGLAMHDVHDIAKTITEQVGPDAKIIFGAIIDRAMRKNEVRVTVIATGLGDCSSAEAIVASGRETLEHGEQQLPVSVERVWNTEPRPIVSTVEAGEEDPFEIPAFLRRKPRRP